MNKLLPKTTFVFCLTILAFAIFWLPIQADDEPTAVHLASFDVIPQDNAIRIEWSTASELSTAGYRIKRAASGGSEEYLDYVGTNGFIPGTGGVTIGGDYAVTDNQVQNGEVYTYILIEVENSGTEVELDRATVTVGIPPTNTPVVIRNGNGGSNPTTAPTATTNASSNASATPTTQSSSGTTVNPTNTPPSFVTITPSAIEPTASPTQSTSTSNVVNTNSNPTSSDDQNAETSSSTLSGVMEVFAEEEAIGNTEEEIETIELAEQTDVNLVPQGQEDYPVGTPTATAVAQNNDTYPEGAADDSSILGNPTSTSIPVIGSNQGYTGIEQDSPTNATNSGGTASSTQGRIFLWIGFIVALLIFSTGLIGSILLFTRKSN